MARLHADHELQRVPVVGGLGGAARRDEHGRDRRRVFRGGRRAGTRTIGDKMMMQRKFKMVE